jgi:hypothetical protein
VRPPRGYDAARHHMPPLMVSVWDAETDAAVAGEGANEVAGATRRILILIVARCPRWRSRTHMFGAFDGTHSSSTSLWDSLGAE